MLALLAQVQNQNPNQNQADMDEFFIFVMAFACVFLVLMFIVSLFFLATLSRTLSLCHPENRRMEPGQVWLNLIPLFNLVWMFLTAIRVSESLHNEYYDRGWHRRGETYASGLGIATCVVAIVAGGLPFLVMLIVYWIKIAEYKRQLATPFTEDDYDDVVDDEHDDRDDSPREERDRDDRRGRKSDPTDDGYEDRPWERR